MLNIQLVSFEYSLSSPHFAFDLQQCKFFNNRQIQQNPVIHIFGICKETKQKVCLHIHQIYPYFILSYFNQLDQFCKNDNFLHSFLLHLGNSIEKSLQSSDLFRKQFVHDIVFVKGISFYGFHQNVNIFLKIYLYNPRDITKIASILQNTNILQHAHGNCKLQIFEAHLPYSLQFMIDYNVYGMNYIQMDKIFFRSPIIENKNTKRLINLNNLLITNENVVQFGTILTEKTIKRYSNCEIEIDIFGCDILNRKQTKEEEEHKGSDNKKKKLVGSLHVMWEERKKRRISLKKNQLNTSSFSINPSIPISLFERKPENSDNTKELEEILWDYFTKKVKESFPAYFHHLRDSNSGNRDTVTNTERLNIVEGKSIYEGKEEGLKEGDDWLDWVEKSNLPNAFETYDRIGRKESVNVNNTGITSSGNQIDKEKKEDSDWKESFLTFELSQQSNETEELVNILDWMQNISVEDEESDDDGDEEDANEKNEEEENKREEESILMSMRELNQQQELDGELNEEDLDEMSDEEDDEETINNKENEFIPQMDGQFDLIEHNDIVFNNTNNSLIANNTTYYLGDFIYLRAPKDTLPYIGYIEEISNDKSQIIVRWFYRSNETKFGKLDWQSNNEIFLTSHKDSNSVKTILGKCKVYLLNDYLDRYGINIDNELKTGLHDKISIESYINTKKKIVKDVYFCRFEYSVKRKEFKSILERNLYLWGRVSTNNTIVNEDNSQKESRKKRKKKKVSFIEEEQIQENNERDSLEDQNISFSLIERALDTNPNQEEIELSPILESKSTSEIPSQHKFSQLLGEEPSFTFENNETNIEMDDSIIIEDKSDTLLEKSIAASPPLFQKPSIEEDSIEELNIKISNSPPLVLQDKQIEINYGDIESDQESFNGNQEDKEVSEQVITISSSLSEIQVSGNDTELISSNETKEEYHSTIIQFSKPPPALDEIFEFQQECQLEGEDDTFFFKREVKKPIFSVHEDYLENKKSSLIRFSSIFGKKQVLKEIPKSKHVDCLPTYKNSMFSDDSKSISKLVFDTSRTNYLLQFAPKPPTLEEVVEESNEKSITLPKEAPIPQKKVIEPENIAISSGSEKSDGNSSVIISNASSSSDPSNTSIVLGKQDVAPIVDIEDLAMKVSPPIDKVQKPTPNKLLSILNTPNKDSPIRNRTKNYSSLNSELSINNSKLNIQDFNNQKLNEQEGQTELTEKQHLTICCIECYALTRFDFLPDPNYDSVQFIIMTFEDCSDPINSLQHYLLFNRELDLAKFKKIENLPQHIRSPFSTKFYEILNYENETYLFNGFIQLIKELDPDILLGYEIQTQSLGYLIESRTINFFFNKNNKNKPNSTRMGINEYGRTHQSGITIKGRIVINVWRILKNELKLDIYSLQDVCYHLLKKRIPSYTYQTLSSISNECSHEKEHTSYQLILNYFLLKTITTFDILNNLDIINRTSELSKVFGIEFFNVLFKGSQYRVESMMLRLTRLYQYIAISPTRKQVMDQSAIECLPLVMEPESKLYTNPVIILDFQSLYPSIIIAHNLCYSTCLGKLNDVFNTGNVKLGTNDNYFPAKELRKLLKDCFNFDFGDSEENIDEKLKDIFTITPNQIVFVKPSVRTGILPTMLSEILETRLMVKQAMKHINQSTNNEHSKRVLNARQLGLKLIANVTYGYTSANFSGRMPLSYLADSIVQLARQTLENAIDLVKANFKGKCRVVYGDTDSLFVECFTSREEAFKIGKEIVRIVTNHHPRPITLQMERIFQPSFLVSKKRYVGNAYESPSQTKGNLFAKGIETVRRDNCQLVRSLMEKSLKLLFNSLDFSIVKNFLVRSMYRIISGKCSFQDFLFFKKVKLGTYKSQSNLPPAAIVSVREMNRDKRAEPLFNERIPYLVVFHKNIPSNNAKLSEMVIHPKYYLKNHLKYRLNFHYYITKQLLPSLDRLFSLCFVNCNAWYQNLPKKDFYLLNDWRMENFHKNHISKYFKPLHKSCTCCGKEIKVLPTATKEQNTVLCNYCKENPIVLLERKLQVESEYEKLKNICNHCNCQIDITNHGTIGNYCCSLECPYMFRKFHVKNNIDSLSNLDTFQQ
ncbi:hypothetical protein ABK040_012759 [Willaertia magna]